MTSQIKTFLLLALLSGIILVLGQTFGGSSGLAIAAVLALAMNVGSYWFSDSIVLKMYRAREVSRDEAPLLHGIVDDLAERAGIPKPKVCIVPDASPNAFATGRNPDHAVVAVTDGILRLLSPEELRAVVAHEIGHIANRDILVQTVASVLATVVMYLANMMKFAAIFGGGSRDDNRSGVGMAAGILMAVLAPIAASLIQMAISRSREFLADASGAQYSGSPLALASALSKLESYSKQIPMQRQDPATESMFIVSPLFGGNLRNLFSTHPSTEARIARLRAML